MALTARMKIEALIGVLGLLGIATALGCSRAEPPAPDGVPWRALPEPDAASAVLEGPPRPATTTLTPTTPPTPTPTTPSTPDPSLLPQTTDKPAPSSPSLDARIALLWTAIVRDDPDSATPAFFPVGAYQQVKDVPDPSADWKHRLLAAFRRDIHAFHAVLGDGAAQAKFVSFDVPDSRARWVDPGEEWNKIGYFRVFNSKLRYDIDGTARALEVKSMISWRGEWYVVHLAAIK